MRQRPGPTLVINPAADFRLALLARDLAGPDSTPEKLQQTLRHDYPNLVVRRRELSGENTEIWYLYREGHWIPPDPPDQEPSTLAEKVDVES